MDEKRAAVGYGALGGSGSDDAFAPASGRTGQSPLLKYSPDQPRVPSGNSDGGQWTDGGGGIGAGLGAIGRIRKPGSNVQLTGGRGKLLRQMLDALAGSKPKTIPEFLAKKPRTGKISGKLDDLTPDERSFAEEMRDLGNDVELIPRGAGRTGDFKINGKSHEVKTVSGVQKTDAEGLSDAISSRILDARGQARDIIIDARKQPGMTRGAAEQAVKRAYGADAKGGIDSITILTPDGPLFEPRR